MKHSRRHFLQFAGAAAALPAVSRIARAQAYPTRPVVGFPPGAGTDTLARLTGQWLSERLGKPFVIENRPGAGATIATEVVVRAPADGHTLLMVTTTAAINATLYEKLSYNFLRDITPVAGIDREPSVFVVHPSFPTRTLDAFIAYAKQYPDKISMASPGAGTLAHLSGELLKLMAGIRVIHVPYRGGQAMITDALSGQVQAMVGTIAGSIEHIRAGRLLALAVSTATRLPALPDIPTVSEFIAGYEASAWSGIGAPRNTPADAIETLNREINAGLADPKVKARLADLGGTAFAGTPADFGKLIADETEKWGKVIRRPTLSRISPPGHSINSDLRILFLSASKRVSEVANIGANEHLAMHQLTAGRVRLGSKRDDQQCQPRRQPSS
jgi:tripartite-type tricarboxylate transporter receptor subunit TctC